jgi:flagellar motor switch protein FliG
MPQKLTTTVNKITTLSNSVDASIIDEFYQYMRSTGTSEHHQNNSPESCNCIC